MCCPWDEYVGPSRCKLIFSTEGVVSVGRCTLGAINSVGVRRICRQRRCPCSVLHEEYARRICRPWLECNAPSIRNVPFRRRALIQLDDALQVQSTALVSDEFLVNADVLVADFARNMLDEYVDRGCDAVRRRYNANTLQ